MEVVDVILWTVYLLIAAATVVSVVSAVHGARTHRPPLTTHHSPLTTHPSLFTLLVMVITYAAASTTPLTINGKAFTSTTWLRLTDMFIYTSITLIILCFIIVVVTKFRR